MSSEDHDVRGYITLPPSSDGADQVAGPNIELSVDMYSTAGDLVPVGLEDFLDVFTGSPLQRLDLEIEPDQIGDIHWRAVLAPFPKLEVLSISSEVRAYYVSLLFAALRPDKDPGEGTVDERRASVLCPQLIDVRYEGLASSGCHPEKIAECLERRRAHLGSDKGLEKLTLSFKRETSATPDRIRQALSPLVSNLSLVVQEQ
ncbi:hypothetical protein C8Q80DRAFT_1275618 [Daedaleopsis nitida]|nr:hypothetical protein C8Q80DRAFT_1275618 [Daedaleopsis nitida]